MEEKGRKGLEFDPLLTIWRHKVGLVGLKERMKEIVGSIPLL